jgi:hypothetical protein
MAMRVLNDPAVDTGADPAPTSRGLQASPNAADWDALDGGLAATGVVIGCAVTLHAGGAAVDIAAGIISVDGYEYLVPATSNVAITSGDATNFRIDQVLVAAGSTPGGASGTPAITTGAANVLAAQKSLAKNANSTPSSVILATLTVAPTLTTIASTDILDKRVMLTNQVLSSGWICDSNAVTKTGSGATTGAGVKSSFTQAVDSRRRYRRGTRVRWYESGTEKFGVVATDATFGSGVTTVTLVGNNDYAMTATPDYGVVFVSHIQNPSGYPHRFNYTPTFGGMTTQPSLSGTGAMYFTMEGQDVKLHIEPNVSGTGTSATTANKITFGVPDGLTTLKQCGCFPWFATDGAANVPSAAQPCPFNVVINAAVTTGTIFKDATQGATWTASALFNARFILPFQAA